METETVSCAGLDADLSSQSSISEGGLGRVCTFDYSSKIPECLIYPSFEWAEYGLRYSTQGSLLKF